MRTFTYLDQKIFRSSYVDVHYLVSGTEAVKYSALGAPFIATFYVKRKRAVELALKGFSGQMLQQCISVFKKFIQRTTRKYRNAR